MAIPEGEHFPSMPPMIHTLGNGLPTPGGFTRTSKIVSSYQVAISLVSPGIRHGRFCRLAMGSILSAGSRLWDRVLVSQVQPEEERRRRS